VKAIAEHLEMEDKHEVMDLLLWLMWGESTELFMQHWRDRTVPAHAGLLRSDKIDKKLPVMRLWLTEEKAKLEAQQGVKTLYGRPLRSPSPSHLLVHELLGSVHDIMNVAVVSFANNDSENHYIYDSPRTWERGTIVGHTSRDAAEWEEEMTYIAQLDNPLIVPLGAKVSIG
jgi:hypothetical protein